RCGEASLSPAARTWADESLREVMVRCTISLTAALQHETPVLSQCMVRFPFLRRHAPPIARSFPMAAAETLKNTVEQFSTASNQAFKDGVEKSLAALAEANTH